MNARLGTNLLYYVRIVNDDGLMVEDRDFTNWQVLKQWALENYPGYKLFVTHPQARETDVYYIKPRYESPQVIVKEKLIYEYTHRGIHVPAGLTRLLAKRGSLAI